MSILIKTKCNYCKEEGHTVSCPLIKELESKSYQKQDRI